MNHSSRLWVWTASFLLCTSMALGQSEQWLKYRMAREASEIVNVLDYIRIGTVGRPEGVGMPQFKAADTIFARWTTPMVKAGFLWIALDRSDPAKPYDLLYIDSDCDGDLSDEAPQEAYRLEESSLACFGPVKVVFKGEDGPVAYHLNARYYVSSKRFYVCSAGWYEGSVQVAGQPRYAILADRNANGTFDDRSLDFGQADRISLAEEGRPAFEILGRLIEEDDRLYALEVARDGAFVVVTPAKDVTLGEVRLPEAITLLRAAGEMGQFSRVPKDGRVTLPTGAYRIDCWAIDRKDAQGRNWRVEGSGFGDKGLFEVRAAEPVRLDVGEPLISTLTADAGENGAYSFGHAVAGRSDESIALTMEGSRASAPRLRVRDKTGQYDRTFNFEYG